MLSAMGRKRRGQSAAAAQQFNADIAGRDAGLAREAAAYDANLQERQARMQSARSARRMAPLV